MNKSLEKLLKIREQKISHNSYGAICFASEGKVILDGVEYDATKITKFDAVRYNGENFALIDCGNRNYFSAKLCQNGFEMDN